MQSTGTQLLLMLLIWLNKSGCTLNRRGWDGRIFWRCGKSWSCSGGLTTHWTMWWYPQDTHNHRADAAELEVEVCPTWPWKYLTTQNICTGGKKTPMQSIMCKVSILCSLSTILRLLIVFKTQHYCCRWWWFHAVKTVSLYTLILQGGFCTVLVTYFSYQRLSFWHPFKKMG